MNDPRISRLCELLLQGRRNQFSRGQEFQNSDSHQQMSVIKSGFVKRYTIRNDGSLSTQGIYGPGTVFPLTLAHKLLLDQDIHESPEVVYYAAMTNCVIYGLDDSAFVAAFEKDPSLYKELFFVSGHRTHSNIQRLENVSLLVYYNRVAHQLLYLARQYGKNNAAGLIIEVPLTQQDIADILSATRETVSLCFTRLKKQSIIEMTPGKKIIICNMEQLEAEAYA